MSAPIVVVGAGFTGLGAAQTLRRAGRPVILLERADTVGGLARSVDFDGHRFDVGPHYFFLDVSEPANELLRSCLRDEEWRTIDFRISAYIGRAHVAWPPTLRSALKLPPTGILQYLKNVMRGTLPSTYVAADYLQGVYGRFIYRIFLDPYLRKKIPVDGGPSGLHRDWYNQTARTIHNVPDVKRDKALQYEPDLVRQYLERYPQAGDAKRAEAATSRADPHHHTGILRVLRVLQGLARSVLAQTYKPVLYPPGGVGVLCQRLAQDLTERGGDLRLGAANVQLEAEGQRVRRVSWDGGTVEDPPAVIWTGSVQRLASLVGLPREELPFVSIVLALMKLRRPLKKAPELYTYVADPSVIFNRVYYPTRSVPGLCPPGKDSLCVEVTPLQALGQDGAESLREPILSGLEKLRICRPDDVEAVQFLHVADAYPVYPLDYRERLTRLWSGLDRLRNLRSVGRSGQFWYNNMARSLRAGIEVAQDVLGVYRP